MQLPITSQNQALSGHKLIPGEAASNRLSLPQLGAAHGEPQPSQPEFTAQMKLRYPRKWKATKFKQIITAFLLFFCLFLAFRSFPGLIHSRKLSKRVEDSSSWKRNWGQVVICIKFRQYKESTWIKVENEL